MKLRSAKISDIDLTSILLNPRLNSRGQYICDCPFCGKDSHFYISKKTQLWDCKKCGEFGSIYKLLKQLDKTYLLLGATIVEREELKSIRTLRTESGEDEEEDDKPLPKKLLPVGYKVLKNSNEYLLNRGVTPADCRRYGLGMTKMLSKFDNYIIVPIIDEGVVRGFLGRYGAKKVPDDKLRYNNSKDTAFSKLLFGYDEITEKSETVILVEGVFDKIAVDKVLGLWKDEIVKCVCTFGKKISNTQINKLLSKGVKNVILLYDFDAIKDIKKYGIELEKYFITSITYTNKKDIDECTFDEAIAVFDTLRRPREFNLDVMGKIKK